MQKVNVFKGYRFILWIFLSIVLVTALILVFAQFRNRVAREQEQIKAQVQKSISSMNVLLEKANGSLSALRDAVEFDLNNQQAASQNPLISYVRNDSTNQYFHMDALPADLQKKLGNITGLGKLDTTNLSYQRSVNAALNIGPLLKNSLQNTSGATLAYAVFNDKAFINLYPFIPSKDFKLSQDVLDHNTKVYTEITPQNNPKRQMKWSKIYTDEVGNGLMITAYIPFFKGNTLEGILGVDLTLDSLNAVINESQRKLGTLFVTTRDQQLLAHPKISNSTKKTIPSTKEAFPQNIQATASKNYPNHAANTFVKEGNYWVYSENIPRTNWRITYLVNYWDIYFNVFRDIGLNTVFVLITIFALLFFTNRYSQRRFISPAMSLVAHIQNENDNLPPQSYNVPRQWQQWFDVISSIFANNRRMVAELKEYNEELEQKVADRTQEITTQNEELIQNQEEITSQRDYITAQNKKLKAKEEKIQQSLQAALTIQEAVLPPNSYFKEFFADYFVLAKPRDVVSGDFYWVWQKSPSELIMMVGDCTGHGIPGAFMSLITTTLLDRITRINKVEQPAAILSSLHNEVHIMLHQDKNRNNSGLEGAIFCMQKQEKEYKLTFASARSLAFYVTHTHQEIQVLDCDRDFIGGFGEEHKAFSNRMVTLPLGSMLYLGSDGYADQHNVARKKIGRKRLKEALFKIRTKTLSEQKQHLEHCLEEHMKDTDQRDDILVIGLKL